MGRVLLIRAGESLRRALDATDALDGHELETCGGNAEAIRCVRALAIDVVLTNPETTVSEDLALVRELADARPGVRVIVFSQTASREEVIAAIGAHVFACFTSPFDDQEVIDMVRAALAAGAWQDGLEVVSGLPDWFTLRVSCRLLTAARLVRFMSEYRLTLADDEHDLLMTAFREMLLNAMEHGGGFDPESVIDVTAAKTARAIVYHFRDSGRGFDRRKLGHVVTSPAPTELDAVTRHRREHGLRPGGFGLLIARQIADELVFNERGNEVLLIKHLS